MLVLGACGCSRTTLRADERPTSRPVQGIGRGYFEPRVQAFLVPPRGWQPGPVEALEDYTHLTWLSPGGKAAYGAIYLQIPGWVPTAIIPVKSLTGRVLDEFVSRMRTDQGQADLLSSEWVDDADAMDFSVRGTTYTLQSRLTVRGKRGWVIYRGVLTGEVAPAEEVAVADRARDATAVGREAAEVGDPPSQ